VNEVNVNKTCFPLFFLFFAAFFPWYVFFFTSFWKFWMSSNTKLCEKSTLDVDLEPFWMSCSAAVVFSFPNFSTCKSHKEKTLNKDNF
jgi:hypothetical protein